MSRCESQVFVWLFQERLTGVLVISARDALQHQGVSLGLDGLVNLQLSSKSVGVFEAFYNSVKVNVALTALVYCPPQITWPSLNLSETLPHAVNNNNKLILNDF